MVKIPAGWMLIRDGKTGEPLTYEQGKFWKLVPINKRLSDYQIVPAGQVECEVRNG